MIIHSPKIATDGLVLCVDPSSNKSFSTGDLVIKNGLLLWLDSADDSVFSYSSITNVSQWRDKSGNNNHVNQSNSTYQPARSTNTFSKKTVEFSLDYLNTSSNILKAYTSYTKIVVAKQTSIATQGNIIGRSTGADTTMWYNASNNIKLYHNGNTILTSSIATTINTWNILSGTFDANALTANIYVNGSSGGSATSPTVTQLTTDSDVQIGAFGNGNNFTGEIAEILIYNRVLSSTELKQVHTYLGQKWGINNTDKSIINLTNNSILGTLSTDAVLNQNQQKTIELRDTSGNGSQISFGNIDLNLSALTVDYWFKLTSDPNIDANNTYRHMFIKDNSFFNYLEEARVINFTVTKGSVQYRRMGNYFSNVGIFGHGVVAGEDFGTAFNIDQWYNVVFIYDNSNGFGYYYLNGKLLNSGVMRQFLSPYTAITAGNIDNSTSTARFSDIDISTTAFFFPGRLGSLRIYNKPLSASEVASNYEFFKTKFINTIVERGLVLNLDANNSYSYARTGTIWYDVSGNSNNGTLNNLPISDSNSGGSFLFNGTSQYVGVANSSSLQIADTFTVSAWIKAADLSNRYGVFSTRANNTTGCWQFEVGTGSGGTGRVVLTGIGTFIAESVNSVITTNTWYHITVVKVNNATQGATFYINGSAVSNVGTAAYTISNNSDEKRIAIGTSSGQYFPGYIAQTLVYNRALSASEILQNYNATKTKFGII